MTFSTGSISHGTLRSQDMLRSFAEAYKEQEHPMMLDGSLYVGAKALALYLDNSSNPSQMEYDVAAELIDDLIDKLEVIAARHGCYFGATEGDASDFGFWPNEGGEADDPFIQTPDEI